MHFQISDIAKINENFNVPKPKVRRTPEYYRPMDVTFRLEVKSIRANCAMNSPCLSVDHPGNKKVVIILSDVLQSCST